MLARRGVARRHDADQTTASGKDDEEDTISYGRPNNSPGCSSDVRFAWSKMRSRSSKASSTSAVERRCSAMRSALPSFQSNTNSCICGCYYNDCDLRRNVKALARALELTYGADRLLDATAAFALVGTLVAPFTGRPAIEVAHSLEAAMPLANTSSNGTV